MNGLSCGEEIMTIYSAVLIPCQRVTDRQTDGRTSSLYLLRASAQLTHVNNNTDYKHGAASCISFVGRTSGSSFRTLFVMWPTSSVKPGFQSNAIACVAFEWKPGFRRCRSPAQRSASRHQLKIHLFTCCWRFVDSALEVFTYSRHTNVHLFTYLLTLGSRIAPYHVGLFTVHLS